MELNDQQKECAEHFDKPAAVIAGAGSGKTKTLQERAANALNKEFGSNDVAVAANIDEVLAITFTEKAAAELKARVRATLREKKKPEQAMLVDDAWISTIHAMCSRILRENAVTLGIDPRFTILTEDARRQMLAQAIDQELSSDPAIKQSVSRLFAEYRGDTLRDAIAELIAKVSANIGGFDSIMAPDGEVSRDICDKLMTAGDATADDTSSETAHAPLDELVSTAADGTDPTTSALARYRLAWGRCLLEDLVDVAHHVNDRFLEAKLEIGAFDNTDLLVQTAKALQNGRVRSRYENRFKVVMVDEFQDTDTLQLSIIQQLCGGHEDRLCVVGDPQQSIYRFRNADPSVCSQYVTHLEKEGSATIRLDKNYRSHKDILDFVDIVFGAHGEQDDTAPTKDAASAETGSSSPQEDDPGTIVEKDTYQRLVYQRNEKKVEEKRTPFDPTLEGPRICVMEVEHSHNQTGLTAFKGALIAERFKALHERGAKRGYGEMVILLGKMGHAENYAEALARLGIPCAITGGSVFNERADAHMVLTLAQALANPTDAEAAMNLLTSDLFGLDAVDLEVLCPGKIGCGKKDGLPGTRDVGKALVGLLKNPAMLPKPDGTRLAAAVRTLSRALARVGTDHMSAIMRDVLYESGWVVRVQGPEQAKRGTSDVSDRARVADALKAIRMVRALEQGGTTGPRQVAVALEAQLGSCKEAPGVLSANNSEFVRIMTVHAAKGLEFPVVAVSELTPGPDSPTNGALTMETMHGRTYVALDCDQSLPKDNRAPLKACLKTLRETGTDPLRVPHKTLDSSEAFGQVSQHMMEQGDVVGFYQAICAYHARQEAAELDRKVYVALTRAEDALIVVVDNGLTGGAKHGDAGKNLEGASLRMHNRADLIEEAGGRYRVTTTDELKAWTDARTLPSDLTALNVAPNDQATAGEASTETTQADDGAWISTVGSVPSEVPTDYDILRRYSPQWAAGVLSPSALKESGGKTSSAFASKPPVVVDEDTDEAPASAPEKGTAFHECCQWMALHRKPSSPLELLPSEREDAIARHHGLNDNQRKQLDAEIARWLESPTAKQMASHETIRAEVPFFVELGDTSTDAGPLKLQGFIDLLAYDKKGEGEALVVDYKTGTSLDTDEKRRKTYEIQARCYAYAVMLQGFDPVRLRFVFVDQPDEKGLPSIAEFPAPGEQAYGLDDLKAWITEKVKSLQP